MKVVAAYFRRMASISVTKILLAIAVLLAPLNMIGDHAAMAMPATQAAATADHMQAGATSGHCADMGADRSDRSDRTSPNIDCMIACSALPTQDFEVETHAMIIDGIRPAAPISALVGLHPESEPPPPRLV